MRQQLTFSKQPQTIVKHDGLIGAFIPSDFVQHDDNIDIQVRK